MDIKKLSYKKSAVLFLVSALLILASSLVFAAANRCQMIVIQEGKGAGGTRLEIFPEKVTVPVGTCTGWINWVNDRTVCYRPSRQRDLRKSSLSLGNHVIFPSHCVWAKQQVCIGRSQACLNIPWRLAVQTRGRGTPEI